MPTLVMLSPAPVLEAPGGEVVLDTRFVEGMKLHSQLWPGRICCLMRRGAAQVPEGMRYTRAKLGFDLILTDPGTPLPQALLDQAALVYCAADDMQYLGLAEAMRGRIGRLVYTVEQSLGERLAMALGATRPVRRRLGAAVWNLRHELRFRRALARADGVHLNGLAAASYRRLNGNALLYLDNRIRQPQLARKAEQAARAEHLLSGAPLRLVAVGPLTPDSGVADLLPMAWLLRAQDVPFELEIIGQGPLADRIRDGIAATGLGGQVRLAPPMAHEGRLLPHLRASADIALMPRRLPEGPSAYIEAMGCGLPVLGYANPAWRPLLADSGAGWRVRPRHGALAGQVARLHGARAEVAAASERAVGYAAHTTFEKVFARRMAHLRELAGLDQP